MRTSKFNPVDGDVNQICNFVIDRPFSLYPNVVCLGYICVYLFYDSGGFEI